MALTVGANRRTRQVVCQRYLERVLHEQPPLFGPPTRREDEAFCIQPVRERLRQLERLRDLERELVARHGLVVAAAEEVEARK